MFLSSDKSLIVQGLSESYIWEHISLKTLRACLKSLYSQFYFNQIYRFLIVIQLNKCKALTLNNFILVLIIELWYLLLSPLVEGYLLQSERAQKDQDEKETKTMMTKYSYLFTQNKGFVFYISNFKKYKFTKAVFYVCHLCKQSCSTNEGNAKNFCLLSHFFVRTKSMSGIPNHKHL